MVRAAVLSKMIKPRILFQNWYRGWTFCINSKCRKFYFTKCSISTVLTILEINIATYSRLLWIATLNHCTVIFLLNSLTFNKQLTGEEEKTITNTFNWWSHSSPNGRPRKYAWEIKVNYALLEDTHSKQQKRKMHVLQG